MGKNGFALPLVLVGAGLIVGIVGTVVYFQIALTNQPTQTTIQPTPTRDSSGFTPPQIDETANWKVYGRKQLGFEIKYPGDGYFEVISEGEGVKLLYKLKKDDEVWAGHIAILTMPTDKRNIRELGPFKNSEYTRIGSYEAIKLLPDSQSLDFVGYILINNGKEYDLEVGMRNREEIVRYFDQILSTFKFLD